MSPPPRGEHDVIVCGAGSAGAALAGMLAARGLRVLVLERRTLDRAGAWWINDLPGWMFDEAGVPRPEGSELHLTGSLTMMAGWDDDAPRVTAHPEDVFGVDMRALVGRLQERAMRAGAELRGGRAVQSVREEPGHVRVETSEGAHEARFFVDASGLAGLEVLGALHGTPRDLCAATQEVRRIRDAQQAQRFFERYGAREGDVLVHAGVAGGYSIVNVRRHGDDVFLLAGSIPADGHPPGKELVERFAREHAWIGERLAGGSRAIPLSYARPIVARGRIAVLGDAASQVFSAHGSGTGAGIVAARMLSEAIARGDLGDYQHGWQRRYGLLFAAHDLFRRLSQDLSPDEIRALVAEGILGPSSVEAAVYQRFPGPSAESARAARALARRPRLAARFGRLGARIAGLAALYAVHPREPAKQEAWADRIHRAMR